MRYGDHPHRPDLSTPRQDMTIPSPTDPRLGSLRQLRDEHRRRDPYDQSRAIELAGAVARFVRSDDGTPADSDTLRSVAVALTAIGQLWLATGHLTARQIHETLPLMNHSSLVAEGLVVIADRLDLHSEARG